MRVHTRFATGLTIVLGTLVASALAILVTLATSDLDRWPGWLRPIHQWAWWTILVLIAAACLLAVWERRRQGSGAGPRVLQKSGAGGISLHVTHSKASSIHVRAEGGRTPPDTQDESDAKDTPVDSTDITQVGGVNVIVTGSKVGRFTITVTNRRASDPLPRIHGITAEPIGRTQEIDLLTKRLRFRSDRSPIFLITGPPGVGKSTLAHFVANVLAVDDYPDGQLRMQLSQQDGGRPPGAGELLRTMLAALGAPAEGTAPDQGLQKQYLQAFDDRHVLLLLEGAQTAEQVLALLPPNGCAAIITSQQALPKLERDAMIPALRLDTLSLWRSFAFLDQRIARKRVARAPLATLLLAKACNGFPLALAAVSSRFTTPSGRSRSVRHAMHLLRDGLSEGLPEIEAAFALGLEACDRQQRKMFQVLGLAGRLAIETAAAAAAAGVSTTDASHQLRALADASLLQAVGPDRWQLHQLVRSYAEKQAGRLGDHERALILEHLEAYDQARELARSSPKEPRAARAWLQVAQPRTDAVLKGVVDGVFNLSQAGLEGLASLLLEVISLNPRARHASGTAREIRDFAVAQGQRDLVDQVDAWLQRFHATFSMPPPSPMVVDDPGQDSSDAWSFAVTRFQPGEPATLTVDGKHTWHTVADAGGAFTCTLFLPQPPCHAVAVGDWGSRAEGVFC